MLNSPLNASGDTLGTTITITTQTLDTHQRGIRSHTCLRRARAIATHRACAMRAMTLVVHGVVIVVKYIVTMIWEIGSAFPKVVGQVDMVVVDTRVDDSDYNTFARIAQFPHLIGTYLGDILSDFARGRGRLRFFAIRNPVMLHGKTDDFNVVATSEVLDGRFCGIEIQGIRHPQNGGFRH